ncbi:hypothetical protein GCM10011386_32220 [Parapedobacter defluvii]|uniref:Starch-binding associating with outer membrane n=1 Tax=Parapedobacter defluvii TaxID=2045106 RepID=A0ABQ1MDY2_9SPHI|nr:SusD/RagB family nutrient-binding outer membrane lipoprotein [Parapedobacter defluvii]GGC37677.1 hypothetical protein GCM10011386_32220 [Parapedobacter defluvii]
MKVMKTLYKLAIVSVLFCAISCSDKLTEANIDPNVVDPATGNPNMIMPTVLATAATDYLLKGWNEPAGIVQHIQHDSWNSGINHYDWTPQDWTNYYGMLRNNNYLLTSPNAYPFHEGVALTMKAFIFGMITDLWGDAPYTDALKGDEGLFEPVFDTQETIYRGILADLQAASDIFATGDNSGYLAGYDVYYGGDPAKWQRFANSLILRYAMRISEKLPDVAKAEIERVAASGIYIKTPADDAVITYVGTQTSNAWPIEAPWTGDSPFSNFRRRKPGQKLIDQLLSTQDPRLAVWWSPVQVQWVADPTLGRYMDDAIYRNDERLSVVTLPDAEFEQAIAAGNKFTRRFNPNLKGANDPELNTDLYVGLPAGLVSPDSYNGNPDAGQDKPNQHVSLMSHLYRNHSDPELMKSRIISSAEVSFILAEAALKGWSVNGSAESHYLDGIRNSLITWKQEGAYADFVTREGVAFNSATALQQIITQKWIASWTGAVEAWMDFRRTGWPDLKPGPASAQPVLPVRFIYGSAEQLANSANIAEAIKRLEQNQYSNQPNSQWSKPWIIQGTGKPW